MLMVNPLINLLSGFLSGLISLALSGGAIVLVAALVLFYGRIPLFPFKARILIVLAALVGAGGGYFSGKTEGERAGRIKAELVCKQQQIDAQAEGRRMLLQVQNDHQAELDRQKAINSQIESTRRAEQLKAEQSDVSLENTTKELEAVRLELANLPKCSVRNIRKRLRNR